MNLEIARIAEEMRPRVAVSKTKVLGELILIKSKMQGTTSSMPRRGYRIQPGVSTPE